PGDQVDLAAQLDELADDVPLHAAVDQGDALAALAASGPGDALGLSHGDLGHDAVLTRVEKTAGGRLAQAWTKVPLAGGVFGLDAPEEAVVLAYEVHEVTRVEADDACHSLLGQPGVERVVAVPV